MRQTVAEVVDPTHIKFQLSYQIHGKNVCNKFVVDVEWYFKMKP